MQGKPVTLNSSAQTAPLVFRPTLWQLIRALFGVTFTVRTVFDVNTETGDIVGIEITLV